MSKFKPGVYFQNGKQVFLNDKGEVENPRLYYMRTNGLEMYEKYVKPILQIDFSDVLEPYTEAKTRQVEGLNDITESLVPMVSEEMKLKEIENNKKKFNHPDAVNKFGKNMTYYQYEQKVKEEEKNAETTFKKETTVEDSKFTERTGLVIPKSYK